MFNILRKVRPDTIPYRRLSDSEKARAMLPIVDRKERKFIEKHVGVPVHKFSDLSSYLDTGCGKVWATFRACHIVASIVTSTEFKIMAGKKGEREILSGPLYNLWNNPNHWDSLSELLYQWVFHMKLAGHAYWVKDEYNSLGQPLGLYPLLPQHVILIPDETRGVSQYIYRVNGHDIVFDPEEIIYFRRPHPCSIIEGMGDIEPSQDLYNDFINRNAYEESFFKNGAQPSGILTYKGTDDMPADLSDMEEDEWGKLKKWWQAEYAGKNNAGKTAFLTGEWDYTRLGLTQQEMSSIERERVSIEQIFMNHGVPLSLAGWTNAANYATARQDEINFRRYEIVPLIDILVGKLNAEKSLFKNFDGAELQYQLSGLIDVEQRGRDYGPLLDKGGMTLNELRVQMGLEPVENPALDEYYITKNVVPIDMAGLGGETLDEDGELVDPVPGVVPEEEAAGVAPIADEESADPTATLNGAQIASLVQIVSAVTSGELPKATAVQIIAAAYPFTEERAERMLADVEEGELLPPPDIPPPGAVEPLSLEQVVEGVEAGAEEEEIETNEGEEGSEDTEA